MHGKVWFCQICTVVAPNLKVSVAKKKKKSNYKRV